MIDLSRQEPRPVDGIVLWSLSRFARNLLDAQFFKADLRRRGYKVEKVQIGVKRNGEPRYASRWVLDPKWAPLVRKAFEMKADGSTTQQILAETYIFRTNNSLTWFFSNRTYLGIRKCGEIEVPNAHEPLVDKDTWDRVQFNLNAKPRKGKQWLPGLRSS